MLLEVVGDLDLESRVARVRRSRARELDEARLPEADANIRTRERSAVPIADEDRVTRGPSSEDTLRPGERHDGNDGVRLGCARVLLPDVDEAREQDSGEDRPEAPRSEP